MRNNWIAVIVAGALTAGAAAQTSASGSASSNTSVSAGQTGVNAGANANTQTSGGSAGANVNGQAQASHQGNSSASGGAASGTSASANGSGEALNSGTTLQAELTRPIDAKKAKPGDEITAKATQDVKSNGQVVVRKGSKLVGHVTEAQARTKDNAESKLGIVFDHAVLKDGSQVAFTGMVQALAAAQTAPLSAGTDDTMAGGGSVSGTAPRAMGNTGAVGGVVGGAASSVGSTVGGVGDTVGSVGSSAAGTVGGTANGTLSGASRGVVGLKGLTLNSAASGSTSTQASVISSTTQNVKLDSGTQMVLLVTGGAQH